MTAAIALVYFEPDHKREFLRWSIAAAMVMAASAGLVATYNMFPKSHPMAAPQEAAIMIEFAPVAEAPQSLNDIAPGPEMMEAPEMASPPPAAAAAPEITEPLPKVEREAAVTLPLAEPQAHERKPVEKPIDKPEEEKREKPEQTVDKKPQRKERESLTPPAPRTTAAPRSDRKSAAVARAPSAGHASAPAPASWTSQLLAHINRHKQYPSSARSARQQGVVLLSFTMSRNGQVLLQRIARGSGVAALDAEVLAMIQRAQPLPPFPESMPQKSQSITVPISFALR